MGTNERTIKNYGFFDAEDQKTLVLTENNAQGFSVLGFREEEQGDNLVMTSRVEELKDDVVRTYYGSLYVLKDQHEDYKDFMQAVKNNIPVLNDWNIDILPDEIFYISGKVDGKHVGGEILNQEGNYLIVAKIGKIFVNWYYPSRRTCLMAKTLGEAVPGIPYNEENYDYFMNILTRPKLFK